MREADEISKGEFLGITASSRPFSVCRLFHAIFEKIPRIVMDLNSTRRSILEFCQGAHYVIQNVLQYMNLWVRLCISFELWCIYEGWLIITLKSGSEQATCNHFIRDLKKYFTNQVSFIEFLWIITCACGLPVNFLDLLQLSLLVSAFDLVLLCFCWLVETVQCRLDDLLWESK